MDGLLIAAIVTAIGSAVAGIVSNYNANKTNREIADKTNKFNAQQAELANQRNIANTVAQNNYNSPSSIRYRLEQAGFNPYMLSSGDLTQHSSVDAAPSASGVLPTMQSYTPSFKVSEALLNARMLQQKDVELGLQERNTTRLEKDSSVMRSLNQSVTLLNEDKHNMNPVERAKLQGEVDLLGKHAEIMNTEITMAQERLKSLQTDNQIKSIKLAIEQSTKDSQIQKIISDAKLTHNEYLYAMQTLASRVYGVDLGNNKLISDTILTNAEKRRTDAIINGINLDNGRATLTYDYDEYVHNEWRNFHSTNKALPHGAGFSTGVLFSPTSPIGGLVRAFTTVSRFIK